MTKKSIPLFVCLFLGPTLAGLLDTLLLRAGASPGIPLLGLPITWGYVLCMVLPFSVGAVVFGILARWREPGGRPLAGLRLYATAFGWVAFILVGGSLIDAGFLALGHDPYFMHGGREGRSLTSWGACIAAFAPIVGYVIWAVWIRKDRPEA